MIAKTVVMQDRWCIVDQTKLTYVYRVIEIFIPQTHYQNAIQEHSYAIDAIQNQHSLDASMKNYRFVKNVTGRVTPVLIPVPVAIVGKR